MLLDHVIVFIYPTAVLSPLSDIFQGHFDPSEKLGLPESSLEKDLSPDMQQRHSDLVFEVQLWLVHGDGNI